MIFIRLGKAEQIFNTEIGLNYMSTEIKDNLHKLISETEDEVILGKVQAYLTTLQSRNIDW